MAYDRFMIAPYDTGLKLDTKPWMSPENAFERLDNAYTWRGRVRKRVGSHVMNEAVDITEQQYYTRLRQQSTPILVGTTSPAGALAGIVPGGRYGLNQWFTIGAVTFTVTSALAGAQPMTRNPAGGTTHTFNIGTGAYNFTGEAINTPVYFYPNGPMQTDGAGNATGFFPGVSWQQGQMISVNIVGATVSYTAASNVPGPVNMISPGVGTFDVTTGAYTIVGSLPNANIFFYPNTPVMGFCTYETGLVNDNPTYAFDTQFAYEFTGAIPAWRRLGLAAWTGNETQFFWSSSWRGLDDSSNILFVTNFNVGDPIRYWDGLIWTDLVPVVSTGTVLNTCRILVVFQNHLVALNGIENGAAFVNRAYWSAYNDPLTAANWNVDIPGGGGQLDAPTKESIITATIIKNRLIVYCAQSTWELVYLNNEVTPFRWEQLNSELGAQSTFSCINFDRNIIGIGSTGIHSCNGVTVERIDNDIPDEVYNMLDTETGVTRTCGIRDFKNEMIYWSVPRESKYLYDTSEYPNSILAYNYKNNSWSYFDDTVTAWGYYRKQTARTWADIDAEWQVYDETWDGGDLQNNPKLVMGGNHHGWTFLFDPDYNKNSMSLDIANIDPAALTFTVPLHNLPQISFVYIENSTGITNINGLIYKVIATTANLLTIDLQPGQVAPIGIYTGEAVLTRVSQINIQTKDFNFYVKDNRNTAIYKVDFLVNSNRTLQEKSQIFVECSPSYSQLGLVDSAITSGCILGTGVLGLEPYPTVPLEAFQDQFWHPVYVNAEGESVQFTIYYTYEQMIDPNIVFAGFQLQAMTIYAMPTSYNMR